LAKSNCFLGQVRHVVVDEADTLCDTFYEKDTLKLLTGMQKDCVARPQIVIVGATRTGAVSAFLRKHLNDTPVLPIVTTDAHMPPPQVDQVFVPTRGKRRLAVLWDVMAELPAVGRKTLVFTNRVPTCKAVAHSILEHGINAVAMHGNMNPKKRKQVWKAFNGSEADVMVCTNLASRGLDFSNVHHVVMYDFPLNLADYLHRVGRTARGGKAGRVTTITPRRYWPFVTKIQEASKEGKPIEVRHATKNMKKILKLEAWRKAAESNLNKFQKKMVRKRLGVAPRDNLGNKESKRALKAISKRVKTIKQVRYLWKRGILKRGHGLPLQPDLQVEASETQTVSTLVRARDGLLQVMPRRRRQQQANQVLKDAPSTTLDGPPPGSHSEPRGASQRRRRPVM
jgi:superfamily II DNA/RNA helicase